MWNHVMPMQGRVETSFPVVEDVRTIVYVGRGGVLFLWCKSETTVSMWE